MPSPYRIELTRAAERDLRGLEKATLRRVDSAIQALADNPRPDGVVKLKGGTDEYRIRVGAYRILYLIEDDAVLVTVVRVGHRRDVYG